MSDQTAQEPTMEEILASIRRIISEDDAPGGAPAEAAAPEPLPEVAPEPLPIDDEEEDILELTEPAPVETVGDLDVYTPPKAQSYEAEPEPEPEPVSYEPEPEPYAAPPVRARDEGLVSSQAAASAASAFGALSAAIGMPSSGRTLEDVTRELLKPLLKQWLDDNLPRIVQAKVDEEVERIARGR